MPTIHHLSREGAALAGALAVLLAGCAQRPVQELQQAREAVAEARDFEADIYAPEEFEMAVFNLEGGEYAIATVDQAPFWGRDSSNACGCCSHWKAEAPSRFSAASMP